MRSLAFWIMLSDPYCTLVQQFSVIQRMHRKLNPVFYACFSHQPAQVGPHSALFDAQLACDFSIGLGIQDQFEYLLLSISKKGIGIDNRRAGFFQQSISYLGQL